MKRFAPLLLYFIFALFATAETVTYRIAEYNADAGNFTLTAFGQRPVGSYAMFENEWGATAGNRYNQIPRNRQATLWLEGWDGCRIDSVTLYMCSNISSGTAALQLITDDATLYTEHAEEFSSAAWFGHWISKDLHSYVEVGRGFHPGIDVPEEGYIGIAIKGGTHEGSVYVDAISVHYTPEAGVITEMPLGWSYEKLEAKSTLNDGDVVMLYRSGDAAGDIDGMETSHYLDAIGLHSTGDVNEPFVEFFTIKKQADGTWTLTDQYERQLGATAKQALAWDAGVRTWKITLGYNGATIASTNDKYGTLRYNAPVESYPRFWNYTSTSLPLPYLYRRQSQHQPITCTSIALSASQREVAINEQDTLMLCATLQPTTTTDWRTKWSSSDEQVAIVKSGVVFLKGPGTAIITVKSVDSGVSAQCEVIIKETPEELRTSTIAKSTLPSPAYDLQGRRKTPTQTGITIYGGKKLL